MTDDELGALRGTNSRRDEDSANAADAARYADSAADRIHREAHGEALDSYSGRVEGERGEYRNY